MQSRCHLRSDRARVFVTGCTRSHPVLRHLRNSLWSCYTLGLFDWEREQHYLIKYNQISVDMVINFSNSFFIRPIYKPWINFGWFYNIVRWTRICHWCWNFNITSWKAIWRYLKYSVFYIWVILLCFRQTRLNILHTVHKRI